VSCCKRSDEETGKRAGNCSGVNIHYRAVLVNKLGDFSFEEDIAAYYDSSATIENGTGWALALQCHHTIYSIHCKPYIPLVYGHPDSTCGEGESGHMQTNSGREGRDKRAVFCADVLYG
jgi:hypothetical protein